MNATRNSASLAPRRRGSKRASSRAPSEASVRGVTRSSSAAYSPADPAPRSACDVRDRKSCERPYRAMGPPTVRVIVERDGSPLRPAGAPGVRAQSARPGTPGCTATRGQRSSCDFLAVPAQDDLRRRQGRHLGRPLSAQRLGFLGQKPTLRVGQAQPLRAEMAAKHVVLRPQVLDRFALLASQPACDQKIQELKRSQRPHGRPMLNAPPSNETPHCCGISAPI